MHNGLKPIWLLLLAPALFAQPATPPEKCIFAGVVQDSVSGQPLPRARVGLRNHAPGKPAYVAATDAAGAFRFEAVEAGEYSIWVEGSEHSPTQSVFLKPGQATSVLRFTAGQSITGAVAAVDPPAVVTGHVTDADGAPIAGAQVWLIVQRWMRGQPAYMAREETIDDRGEYHIRGLGRVFVVAGTPQNRDVPSVFSEGPGKPEMRVATVVYPNSPDLQGATALDLRPGQEYGGIDLHLPTVEVYHVRGAVRPWGSWLGPKSLSLTRRGGSAPYLDTSLDLDKDGGFDVAGVAPGSYWLEALDMSLVGARVPVEVTDRDVEGVVFPAVPPVEIKGRLHFDDGQPHDLSKVHVRVGRLDTGHPLGHQEAEVRADGTFEFHRLASAETSIEITPPGDYYLQSASYNQREVEGGRIDLTSGTSGELEIVLGGGTGTLSGKLRNSDNDAASGNAAPPLETPGPTLPWTPPAGGLVAVLAPAAGVTGNTGVRSASVDQNGRFQFPFVPPGRYYAWVVAHYDPDHWQNMDFVTQMQDRGVAVEMEKNGAAQVEIPAVIQ